VNVLDAYAHILPRRYFDRVVEIMDDPRVSPRVQGFQPWLHHFRALADLDERWRSMEGIEDYRQVVTLAVPPVEELGPPEVTVELARRANDEMAELVAAHPDRLAGFAAGLPLNDVDAGLEELGRAIDELGALGVQIYTSIGGAPVDEPRFAPVFAEVARRGRTVWLHPTRGATRPDYESETGSRFGVWFSVGWPYETSVAMMRLVFSGIVTRHPDLPIITHHGGGMIPQFPERLVELAIDEARVEHPEFDSSIGDQFRRFYADTVLGTPGALRSSIEFFGVERILFATDAPFGPPTLIPDKIAYVEALGLSETDAAAVFHGNASRVLRLV
jgi:predicted TIM-barrel fold metal-dependent hydrolase